MQTARSAAKRCAPHFCKRCNGLNHNVTEDSDEDLMLAVRNGDQEAFAVLVRRHINSLYKYALRLSRCATQAEDLVQETWLAVWKSAHRFSPGQVRLTTWLHRILHNKFVDAHRRNKLVNDSDVIDAQIDPYRPDLDAEQQQQLEHLQVQIDRLPTRQRAALLLTCAQGLSNSEAAQVMGQSRRAVESLLARARRTLKTSMPEQKV